jgi:hypothetical protein
LEGVSYLAFRNGRISAGNGFVRSR